MDKEQLDSDLKSFFEKLGKPAPGKPPKPAAGGGKKKAPLPDVHIPSVHIKFSDLIPVIVEKHLPDEELPVMFHELDAPLREKIKLFIAIAQTNKINLDAVMPKLTAWFNISPTGMSQVWGGVASHIDEYSWGSPDYHEFEKMMGGLPKGETVVYGAITPDGVTKVTKEELIAFIKTYEPEVPDEVILDGIKTQFKLFKSDSIKELVKDYRKYLCALCKTVLDGETEFETHIKKEHLKPSMSVPAQKVIKAYENYTDAETMKLKQDTAEAVKALQAQNKQKKPWYTHEELFTEFKANFTDLFVAFCQSMKEKGIAVPDNIHFMMDEEGVWHTDVDTGPKGVEKAVSVSPPPEGTLPQVLLTAIDEIVAKKMDSLYDVVQAVLIDMVAKQLDEKLTIKVPVLGALANANAEEADKMIHEFLGKANKPPEPATPLPLPLEDELALIHKMLGGQGDPKKLTMKGQKVEYYTIAYKKHHYKLAKGVLMAYKTSWKGDPDVRLCLWALTHTLVAFEVTVYMKGGHLTLDNLALKIANKAGYQV